jgi:hypothetical protein
MFVKCELRSVAIPVIISVLWLICACGSALEVDDSPTALAALQAKADQAQPKDKCFLYARLVNQMTERAGRQFNSGNSGQALETLKLVQEYAEKIHSGVAGDSKRLKDAELLMQRTSFRLQAIRNEASYEDLQTLEETLKELNQVQVQLMTQVFKK